MSNIYHTEPPTNGKVCLSTNYGDIDIELWPREAPLACRNFIQLCLEGYYDNSLAVRLIKGFMVQLGDPTGSGAGGDSIWGKPFKDEIHGRIKFNHRGQVAMANENKPHSNSSQFFITFDACNWLNGKHTIFAKVTGSTIFNVLKLNEIETGTNDKPLEPIKILKATVLMNPFDDIVPRNMGSEIQNTLNEKSKLEKARTENVKAIKNKSLLSFGEEDDEDEEESRVVMKSVHDLKKKKRKIDEEPEVKNPPQTTNSFNPDHDRELKPKEITQNIDKSNKEKGLIIKKQIDEQEDDDLEEVPLSKDSFQNMIDQNKNLEKNLQKKQEFYKIREELVKSRKAVNVDLSAAQIKNEPLESVDTPLEQRRQKYFQKKRNLGDREQETLKRLQNFTTSLREVKGSAINSSTNDLKDFYHGQILENNDADEDLHDWHAGKLKFKKHIDDQFRNNLGSDGRKLDDYEVIDSRNSIN